MTSIVTLFAFIWVAPVYDLAFIAGPTSAGVRRPLAVVSILGIVAAARWHGWMDQLAAACGVAAERLCSILVRHQARKLGSEPQVVRR